MNFQKYSSCLLQKYVSSRTWLIHIRNLTAAETATALRPFYFAVHPDLFGKYPEAREVNEGSLKLLNEYLHNLHNERKVTPVSLVFNVRHTTTPSNLLRNNDAASSASLLSEKVPEPFRTIRISLLSDSLKTTVSTILKSCNLPLDYVNSVKSQPKKVIKRTEKPIIWDDFFYGFSPEAAVHRRRKSFETLSSWLDRNIGKARKNQSLHEGIKIETTRLKHRLIEECGLSEVRWASGWGLTQFRACLSGFLRIYQENKDSIEIKGRSLVFGNENGISLCGNIVVKSDNLADSWVPFLKSIKSNTLDLKVIAAYENLLSHLLNNANIVRRTEYPVILAQEYLTQLKTLSNSLEKYFVEGNLRVNAGTLKDVDVVVECAQGPLHINPAGQVLIPYSCPAFLIVDFFNDNADTAIQMKMEFKKKEKTVVKLVKNCKETLQLQSLTKDANISCYQLESFCKQILNGDPRNIPISLMGCRVKVAQFYSVMSDGEIYLPWNWKGEFEDW